MSRQHWHDPQLTCKYLQAAIRPFLRHQTRGGEGKQAFLQQCVSLLEIGEPTKPAPHTASVSESPLISVSLMQVIPFGVPGASCNEELRTRWKLREWKQGRKRLQRSSSREVFVGVHNFQQLSVFEKSQGPSLFPKISLFLQPS